MCRLRTHDLYHKGRRLHLRCSHAPPPGRPLQLLKIVEEAEKKAKDAAAAGKAAQGGKPAAPTKKTVKRRQPKPVVEEEEEEVHPSWAWSERGISGYEETDAYKRRNKKTETGSSASPVSLSQSARDRMPSLDQFMDTTGACSGHFALEQVVGECFDMNFPKEAVKLFVDKVRLVRFCLAVFPREPAPLSRKWISRCVAIMLSW